jgi:hypothetical protein
MQGMQQLVSRGINPMAGESKRGDTSIVPKPGAYPGAAATMLEGGQRMQVLVLFEVFHTIVEPERLRQAIEATHKQLQFMLESGKVVSSGAFSQKRGGFVILNVDSSAELLRFLAPGFSDNCRIEVQPILSWEEQNTIIQQLFE